MNPTIGAILTALTFILSGLRLSGEKGQFFQAIAHFFVAALFGMAWVYWRWSKERDRLGDVFNPQMSKAYWYFGLAMTASLVELFAFIMGIGK